MDPTTMVYLLIALMTVSGGIMGAFWLRALTLMRRRVIDSAEALEQLVETFAELRNEMTVLGERIHLLYPTLVRRRRVQRGHSHMRHLENLARHVLKDVHCLPCVLLGHLLPPLEEPRCASPAA